MKTVIKINSIIDAPLSLVWECFIKPEHIVNWNFASDAWCCPRAENQLKTGGKLNWRMEAKDGSMGFDFKGVYTEIIPEKLIRYTIEDGREVTIQFQLKDSNILLSEDFEADPSHSIEMQQAGWQAILDNFKSYVLSLKADKA